MNFLIASPRAVIAHDCASLALRLRATRPSALCAQGATVANHRRRSGFSQPQRRDECTHAKPAATTDAKTTCGKKKAEEERQLPLMTRAFWASRATWRRAGVNTFRCLIGCTAGDFSAMWYLQAFHPELGVGAIMGLSMASGLLTSFGLETALLRLGRDGLPSWGEAARTAAGMSLLSMVTMEAAENAVDWHLTGGVVQVDDPAFWAAAAVSVAAGFAAPMPWNYYKLRRFGKACH